MSRLWGSLVAAKLIDNNEKVFAYTFAAPATIESTDDAPHAAKYDSIFNIVNEDDFIPYFPLSQWNFTRYGRTTQNVSISSGYSTIWANSWENYQKNDVTKTYMHMSSPTTPLAEFYTAAGSRNACYEYGPNEAIVTHLSPCPSNTFGYYEVVTVIDPITVVQLHVKQKPMFLMKYFAAVAAGETNVISFVTSDVAPYLNWSKINMIAQIIGIPTEDIQSTDISNIDPDTLRLEYPHLPQSYYLLAQQISYSEFE